MWIVFQSIHSSISQQTSAQYYPHIIYQLMQKKADYYELLGLTNKATHTEIKQAYRKLALIHHPDKNEDKQTAKIKFTQITQAYTVLNDQQKRENYDKYGVGEDQFAQFAEFQEFMNDFGLFEEFLDDFLSFDDVGTLEKMFGQMMGGGGNRKKGGSRRKRGGSSGPSMSMMNKLYEEMMKEALGDLNLDEEDEDEEELSPEELLLLQFGKKNLTKKKKSAKKIRFFCKFDEQKVAQDEILIHFGEKHMKEFEQWKVTRNNPPAQNAGEVKKQT